MGDVFGIMLALMAFLFIGATIVSTLAKAFKKNDGGDTQPKATREPNNDVFGLEYSNVAPRKVATSTKASQPNKKTKNAKNATASKPTSTVEPKSKLTVMQPSVKSKTKDYDKEMQERHEQDCNVKHKSIAVEILGEDEYKKLAKSIVLGEVFGQPVCKKRKKIRG